MTVAGDWDNVAAVILAAGKGTRMKSRLPKVLQPICGKPMILFLVEALDRLGAEPPLVVVGHGAEEVTAVLPEGCKTALQAEQLGTGHAVKTALGAIEPGERTVLALCGDVPLLTDETLTLLVRTHREGEHQMTILTAGFQDPAGYGRIVRGADGWVLRIVEEKDATAAERAITEINTGIYCFEEQRLRDAVAGLTNDNAQGEYYLTDAVEHIIEQGGFVGGVMTADPEEAAGMSDKSDLARASARVRSRIVQRHMLAGVSIDDPSSVYIDAGVVIEPDAVILPGVHLRGRTSIGEGSVIGPEALLEDATVGRGCVVRYSVIVGSEVRDRARVGPFAQVRPGSVIGAEARIGNFVEVKNAVIGDRTRAGHLSYLGDAEVGEDVNIGAGTIFCNYDGVSKHRTVIGGKSFVGSNSTLIAPLELGAESFVAAGTVVSGDVPTEALAIARPSMQIKPGWSKKRRIILDKGDK